MGFPEELTFRAAIEPQALGIDLGDAVLLVENEEALTHGRQHAGVARVARVNGGSGAVRLGDVVALTEDAGDPAGLVPHRLVDEVEEALLRGSHQARLKTDRQVMGDEALTGRIDLVEPLEEALSVEFGEDLAHILSNEVTVAEQAPVGLVDELEDVLRAGAGS